MSKLEKGQRKIVIEIIVEGDALEALGAVQTAIDDGDVHAAIEQWFDDAGTEIVNIEARLLPVDVRDYGAVGDGVTDDTAAIQAAVDTAAASTRKS